LGEPLPLLDAGAPAAGFFDAFGFLGSRLLFCSPLAMSLSCSRHRAGMRDL
jgi:hypothetical protein